MAAWAKTLMGPDVTLDRAFLPMQHAMIRLGYELKDVVPGKRLVFSKRAESFWAGDNHRQTHRATLQFREKSRGVFTKQYYLEVEVTFDDWAFSTTPKALWAWQEIADKLQVMLSEPAVFLPVAPPGPVLPPVSR